MKSITCNIALVFCVILMSARILSAASYCKTQVYKAYADSDEITYEYYELSSNIKLTQTEFEAMKMLLSKAVAKYNHRIPTKYDNFRIRPGNYGIQYKIDLDAKGNKLISINAFAKEKGEQSQDYEDLTTKLFIVFDGGSSFFNTTINLERKSATPVFIHGFA